MNETNNKIKKDYHYVWIALILSLFFWVPLLNIIFFLPLAIILSIKQIKLAKKEPNKYGKLIFPAIILAHSTFSIIASSFILYLNFIGWL
ncbi:hypothetical protein KY343_06390 [Candidatus Woesearchaeota archaeon]|nr:hypothetical protein [Candidatus Woesearchaeota archaeon]